MQNTLAKAQAHQERAVIRRRVSHMWKQYDNTELVNTSTKNILIVGWLVDIFPRIEGGSTKSFINTRDQT